MMKSPFGETPAFDCGRSRECHACQLWGRPAPGMALCACRIGVPGVSGPAAAH